MAYVSPTSTAAEKSGAFDPRFIANRIVKVLSSYSASRKTDTVIRRLSRYSDKQLADIGLQRSDLERGRFERAADARARSMLRVYG